MNPYAIIMFIFGIIFIIVGVLIYFGRAELIHKYHQSKVKDKNGYSKAVGKGIISIGLTLIISGIISLFDKVNNIELISIALLMVGLIICFIILYKIQKKYNDGMF